MKKIIVLIIFIFTAGCSNIKQNSSVIEKKEYTFLKGLNLYQKEKKKEALEEYKKVYMITPEDVVLLKEMALVYYELRDNESSVDFLKKAENLSPKDDDIKKNLSILYFAMGDFEKSEGYLNRISKINCDSNTIKIRGYIAFEREEYEDALEYLKKAEPISYEEKFYSVIKECVIKLNKEKEFYTFLNSNYEKYYNEKAFMMLYSTSLSEIYGETDLAVKVLLRYISQYGGDDEIFLLLSNLYLKNGEKENAESSLKLVSKDFQYDEEYINLKNRIAG